MQQDDQQPAQGAVLLDMDGVICENTLRREYGDDRDYALFGRRCANAAPRMDFIAFAQTLKYDNVAVFILTARSEKLRAKTMAWLKSYKVPVDELLMRPLGNREPDTVLKRKMLTVLRRKHQLNQPFGPTALLAVDDNEDVVKMYQEEGLTACLAGTWPWGQIW